MSSPSRIRFSLDNFTSTNRPRLFDQKQRLEAAVQEVKDSGQWATCYNDLLFSLFTALSQLKGIHSEALSDLVFYGWQPFGQRRLWEEGGWYFERDFVENHPEWYEDMQRGWEDHISRYLAKDQKFNKQIGGQRTIYGIMGVTYAYKCQIIGNPSLWPNQRRFWREVCVIVEKTSPAVVEQAFSESMQLKARLEGRRLK
jgi:hypothetical protein